jgi:hypothetical protein
MPTRYAVQVFLNEDWLYVTTPHPNGVEGDRMLVTYNSKEEAEESSKQWSKFRVIELQDVDSDEI